MTGFVARAGAREFVADFRLAPDDLLRATVDNVSARYYGLDATDSRRIAVRTLKFIREASRGFRKTDPCLPTKQLSLLIQLSVEYGESVLQLKKGFPATAQPLQSRSLTGWLAAV
jgi:hypothetical protein